MQARLNSTVPPSTAAWTTAITSSAASNAPQSPLVQAIFPTDDTDVMANCTSCARETSDRPTHMNRRGATAIGTAIVLLHFTTPTFAHTAIAGSKPKSGSVLEKSPPVVEISFKHTAHMVSVVLHETGKAERQLAFTPSGGATSFRVLSPNLVSGRSEIRWRALSSDGHVISGSLIFVIKPATKQD
jgi:methionine-rich copper-binding protein CopC